MRPHPLDRSVRCHHCGKGDLVFVRTRNSRDLYRCVGEPPCYGYVLHYRRDGKSCGVAPELNYGAIGTWVERAGREPAKGE